MDRSRELTRLEQELDSLFVRLNDRLSFHDLLPLDERATRLREDVGVEILSNTTEAALARKRNRRAVDIVLEAARIESLNEAVALMPRPASKAAVWRRKDDEWRASYSVAVLSYVSRRLHCGMVKPVSYVPGV
ncbi:hypothetical protein ACFX11_032488 [Malus domestica]